MTPECVARARSILRFNCQTATHARSHSNRHASSALLFVRRGRRLHFPSLTHVRERSAGTALVTSGTFWRCRVPCDRHARLPALHLWRFFTRPPHFLAWTGGLHLTLSGQHWHCRSSRPVQPLKAAPSSGAGGDRASRSVVTSQGCGRHTLLRQLDVPRRRPHVSKAGAQNQRQDIKSKRHPLFASSFNTASTNRAASPSTSLSSPGGVQRAALLGRPDDRLRCVTSAVQLC
jgi:hypothetical protein